MAHLALAKHSFLLLEEGDALPWITGTSMKGSHGGEVTYRVLLRRYATELWHLLEPNHFLLHVACVQVKHQPETAEAQRHLQRRNSAQKI